MKKEDVKVKKLNNKGFSLVEIIIVIAIMAILAGALAPQLMKYVEKSRIAADNQNCDTIKTVVETALANENVYESVPSGATLEFNGNPPSGTTPLETELKGMIGKWPSVKENGKKKFVINITSEKVVTVQTSTAALP